MCGKKIIALGLAIMVMLNLAGCGGSPGKTNQHAKTSQTEQKAKTSSQKIEQKSNEVTVKVKR